MPIASFWCLYCWLWTYFTPWSSVSIVNFQLVNARSVIAFSLHKKWSFCLRIYFVNIIIGYQITFTKEVFKGKLCFLQCWLLTMNYVLKLVRNVLLLKWVKQEQINLNIPTMIIVLNWFFRFIKAITGYGVVRRAFYFCVVSLKL